MLPEIYLNCDDADDRIVNINKTMKLKYNTDDRLPAGQLVAYSIQWFVLAIAVVATSVFVAQGSPAEKLFYAQKLFSHKIFMVEEVILLP